VGENEFKPTRFQPMKTTEALKIAAGIATTSRLRQAHALGAADRLRYSSAPTMRHSWKRVAKEHKESADALDQLRADHALLRSELTKVRGMLDYTVNDVLAGGVTFSRLDQSACRKQLKVAAHILKVT
jgi:hypothetical protein